MNSTCIWSTVRIAPGWSCGAATDDAGVGGEAGDGGERLFQFHTREGFAGAAVRPAAEGEMPALLVGAVDVEAFRVGVDGRVAQH